MSVGISRVTGLWSAIQHISSEIQGKLVCQQTRNIARNHWTKKDKKKDYDPQEIICLSFSIQSINVLCWQPELVHLLQTVFSFTIIRHTSLCVASEEEMKFLFCPQGSWKLCLQPGQHSARMTELRSAQVHSRWHRGTKEPWSLWQVLIQQHFHCRV